MGKFVNGLLGKASTADMISQAAEQSRAAAQQAAQPQGPPQGQPQQQQGPSEEEMAMMQQQEQAAQQQGPPQGRSTAPQNTRPQRPILSDNAEAEPDDDQRTGGDMYPPSEEEEKQARVMVANSVDSIFGDGAPAIAKMLKDQSRDVRETISEIAVSTVAAEIGNAENAGKEVHQGILVSVGSEVINQLYEFAQAMGVWKVKDEMQEQQDQAASLNHAVQLFVTRFPEMVDQEQLGQMVNAVKAGEYDSQPGTSMPDTISPPGQDGGQYDAQTELLKQQPSQAVPPGVG